MFWATQAETAPAAGGVRFVQEGLRVHRLESCRGAQTSGMGRPMLSRVVGLGLGTTAECRSPVRRWRPARR